MTEYFPYRDGALYAEGIALAEIAARFGTPSYVYSRTALEEAFRAFAAPLLSREHLVCYAVKANPNLAVLATLAQLGAGFDIVSGGELARVIAAGGNPRKVLFSGVGKTEVEMRQALAADILCFNVESAAELRRLERVAAMMGRRAAMSLRVNPDVDPQTHPYISTGLKQSKFGVVWAEARALYREAARSPHLEVAGLACHIGSQIVQVAPYLEALERMLELADQLKSDGIPVRHLDLGGGFGIRYAEERPLPAAAMLEPLLLRIGAQPMKLLFAPGRALVGNAGLLLTRLEYLKHGEERNFAVVDAAMNDLLRPALYEAWHDIVPVLPRQGSSTRYEVVGPICESGDFLGHGRDLTLVEGDLLAILSAGAYGMSMSSNYNTRPRAAEVMVDGERAHLVRSRERIEELYASETVIP